MRDLLWETLLQHWCDLHGSNVPPTSFCLAGAEGCCCRCLKVDSGQNSRHVSPSSGLCRSAPISLRIIIFCLHWLGLGHYFVCYYEPFIFNSVKYCIVGEGCDSLICRWLYFDVKCCQISHQCSGYQKSKRACRAKSWNGFSNALQSVWPVSSVKDIQKSIFFCLLLSMLVRLPFYSSAAAVRKTSCFYWSPNQIFNSSHIRRLFHSALHLFCDLLTILLIALIN